MGGEASDVGEYKTCPECEFPEATIEPCGCLFCGYCGETFEQSGGCNACMYCGDVLPGIEPCFARDDGGECAPTQGQKP
jgi:hypothetical protein